jgi:hypothetical protein
MYLSDRFAAIDRARSLWKQLKRPEAEFDAFLDLDGATPRKGELVWSGTERVVPDFSLSDLAGRVWSLAGLKGKTTLVNFWAHVVRSVRRRDAVPGKAASPLRRSGERSTVDTQRR